MEMLAKALLLLSMCTRTVAFGYMPEPEITISWTPVPCVYVQKYDAAGQAAWAGEYAVYLPSGETQYTDMVGLGTGGWAQCLPYGNVIVVYTGCHDNSIVQPCASWDNTLDNMGLVSQVCSNAADGNFYDLGLACP